MEYCILSISCGCYYKTSNVNWKKKITTKKQPRLLFSRTWKLIFNVKLILALRALLFSQIIGIAMYHAIVTSFFLILLWIILYLLLQSEVLRLFKNVFLHVLVKIGFCSCGQVFPPLHFPAYVMKSENCIFNVEGFSPLFGFQALCHTNISIAFFEFALQARSLTFCAWA